MRARSTAHQSRCFWKFASMEVRGQKIRIDVSALAEQFDKIMFFDGYYELTRATLLRWIGGNSQASHLRHRSQ